MSPDRLSCRSQNWIAASICSGSSWTHWPRICTRGDLSATKGVEFLVRESRVADGQLPTVVHKVVQTEVSRGYGRISRQLGCCTQLQANTQLRAWLVPPGRGENAEAAALQMGRAVTEEDEGLLGGQRDAGGGLRLQALLDRCEEPAGVAETGEQPFLRSLKPLAQRIQNAAPAIPHLVCGNNQAGVIPRLQEIVQPPLAASRLRCRRFQAECDTNMTVARNCQDARPRSIALVQVLQLRRAAGDDRVLGKERTQPSGRRASVCGQTKFAARTPGARTCVTHVIEEAVQQYPRRNGLIGGWSAGPHSGRHGRSKLDQSSGVLFAVQDGLPASLIAHLSSLPDFEHGRAQFLLCQDFQDEIEYVQPVAAVAAQVDSLLTYVVQRNEQVKRLGRLQPHAFDCPRTQFGVSPVLLPFMQQARRRNGPQLGSGQPEGELVFAPLAFAARDDVPHGPIQIGWIEQKGVRLRGRLASITSRLRRCGRFRPDE